MQSERRGESGSGGPGVGIMIRRLPVQIPLNARARSGTQSTFEILQD